MLLSNPGGCGDVAGHVVGDDDVIVVVYNDILTVLLIALKHQERFDLNKGRFNNLRHYYAELSLNSRSMKYFVYFYCIII